MIRTLKENLKNNFLKVDLNLVLNTSYISHSQPVPLIDPAEELPMKFSKKFFLHLFLNINYFIFLRLNKAKLHFG